MNSGIKSTWLSISERPFALLLKAAHTKVVVPFTSSLSQPTANRLVENDGTPMFALQKTIWAMGQKLATPIIRNIWHVYTEIFDKFPPESFSVPGSLTSPLAHHFSLERLDPFTLYFLRCPGDHSMAWFFLGKSPFVMAKSTTQMGMFKSYWSYWIGFLGKIWSGKPWVFTIKSGFQP